MKITLYYTVGDGNGKHSQNECILVSCFTLNNQNQAIKSNVVLFQMQIWSEYCS